MSLNVIECVNSNANIMTLSCACPECGINSLKLSNTQKSNLIVENHEDKWVFSCMSCNWEKIV